MHFHVDPKYDSKIPILKNFEIFGLSSEGKTYMERVSELHMTYVFGQFDQLFHSLL